MPLKDPQSMSESYLVRSGRSVTAPATLHFVARLDMGQYDWITVMLHVAFNAIPSLAVKLQMSDSAAGGTLVDVPNGSFTIGSGDDDQLQTLMLRPQELKRYLDCELDAPDGSTAQVSLILTGYRGENASDLAFAGVKPEIGMS